jgi:hypothetical protein
MAVIATVSPTELIRSTWGNSVAVELNSNSVKIAGSTMTGDLLLSGTSTNAAAAMPKSYIDTKVPLTGGAFVEGSIWVTRPSTDNYCLRLRAASEVPTIDFLNNALSVQFGWLSMSASDLLLQYNAGGHVQITPTLARLYSSTGNVLLQTTSGTIDFVYGGSVMGRTIGGQFIWGKTVYDAVTPGIEMLGVGSGGVGSFRSIMNTPTLPNLYIRRDTPAVATGTDFAQFLTNVAGVGLGIAGAIRITGSGSGVSYLTSSDYRIKNVIGDVVDALDQCRALQPRLLEMKADPGRRFVGFLAHEVQAVMPSAVSGVKDDVYTNEDAAGIEGIEPGAPKMQQLDVTKLVPLLAAGLKELADRVDTLEGL